ncbi:hypothetical protein [Jeotgalibaca caeni]|uniref:hypothetical protein n=1 Tax=Jeotgalibaca caeni TaxID=3028623 RepID=UPI00237E0D70|nr:hypothetical protein [Jeotgalibaca caeni]MDE1549833.1 hypothetical protein [Jeotgalibaca caeni]
MDSELRKSSNIVNKANESKKKSLFERVKDHKKEIVAGTVIILSVVAIVLVVRNKDSLMASIKSSDTEGSLNKNLEIKSNVAPTISGAIPTSISDNSPIATTIVIGHVRNLPEGWKPSTNKLELARNLGYFLEEHQTWVNSYTKAVA